MRDYQSENHDRSSCSFCSEESMSIAAEMQSIVFSAAEPIRAGDTVKAQQRRAWSALGRPPFWRLRAAWYGEAECWSGGAIEDLRRRARARQAKEEHAREQAQQLGSTYAAFAESLRAEDANRYGDHADGFERLARRLGSVDRPVAETEGE